MLVKNNSKEVYCPTNFTFNGNEKNKRFIIFEQDVNFYEIEKIELKNFKFKGKYLSNKYVSSEIVVENFDLKSILCEKDKILIIHEDKSFESRVSGILSKDSISKFLIDKKVYCDGDYDDPVEYADIEISFDKYVIFLKKPYTGCDRIDSGYIFIDSITDNLNFPLIKTDDRAYDYFQECILKKLDAAYGYVKNANKMTIFKFTCPSNSKDFRIKFPKKYDSIPNIIITPIFDNADLIKYNIYNLNEDGFNIIFEKILEKNVNISAIVTNHIGDFYYSQIIPYYNLDNYVQKNDNATFLKEIPENFKTDNILFQKEVLEKNEYILDYDAVKNYTITSISTECEDGSAVFFIKVNNNFLLDQKITCTKNKFKKNTNISIRCGDKVSIDFKHRNSVKNFILNLHLKV